jgi:exonuclease VII large subunit
MRDGSSLLGLEDKTMFCDTLLTNLSDNVHSLLDSSQQRLNRLNELLHAYAPQNTLNRGFCYVESSGDQLLTSIKDFEALEQESLLSVVFKDGRGKVIKK